MDIIEQKINYSDNMILFFQTKTTDANPGMKFASLIGQACRRQIRKETTGEAGSLEAHCTKEYPNQVIYKHNRALILHHRGGLPHPVKHRVPPCRFDGLR